jgi:hypothetical protein
MSIRQIDEHYEECEIYDSDGRLISKGVEHWFVDFIIYRRPKYDDLTRRLNFKKHHHRDK